MTTTLQAPETPREAARFLETYARHFNAGAFGAPTAKDIEPLMKSGGWHWWDGAAAVSRILTRNSTRQDFIGRKVLLPQGSRVITNLAATADAKLPDLDDFDWVFAYCDDLNVTGQLRAQGREPRFVRVSASSEMIGCWGRRGDGYHYPAVDQATIVKLPLTVPAPQRNKILAELGTVSQWHDDFPYYSDGSWDAVSLRGFNPADPTWGVKPAEMGKSWWAEHPEAKEKYARCEWTVLADKTPEMVQLVHQVTEGWGQLERVRLLRMQGRGGKGGSLSRHSDITDRASGTRDGQIIRFHIPLVTDPRITMSGWNLNGLKRDVHLPAWSLWYLDARKPHAVDNRAGIDRVHLVIDAQASTVTRQAIVGGEDAAA